MKILNYKDINKVRSKFRPMVVEAWKNNETVPYSVTLLSDSAPTEREIRLAHKLFK